ncbi:MAG TPA: serine O-acetyltransferase EpsC [Bacteroidota bacterium]|nr:serine O-acetyltransferase EpsC [Bacteroidota bacterium]
MKKQQTDMKELARVLGERRSRHSPILPVKAESHRFAEELLELLFPHFSRGRHTGPAAVHARLAALRIRVERLLKAIPHAETMEPREVTREFFGRLPELYDRLWLDAEAINRGDPASENVEEVVLAYPGFLAIAIYRIAHEFYLLRVPIFPRLLTEYAHQLTGVDIHPGATLGTPLFIDHGTGIVIGETTTIGSNVKLYQGVTLGALSVEKSLANTKRHPTIEDNVIIYAQAVILGGSTVIGHDSVVGGNSWITRSVPPFSYVYQEIKVNVRTPDETNGGVDFVI